MLMHCRTGVADANAARNNIAKDYMKKCDCIWILAPITRAVDDKTARGIYSSHQLDAGTQLLQIYLEMPLKCN
jgi:16S rRNA G1207 methylase RsmC